MAAVITRDLDDSVRERLRVRAAEYGRPMEAEIRAILTDAVRERADAPGLAGALLDRFGGSSGVGGWTWTCPRGPQCLAPPTCAPDASA